MKITLCIMTRNERECLKVILPTLPPPGPAAGYDEVVAIDGGSTDGSVQLFQENGISVVSQSRSGRGAGILLAFERIKSDAYIFFSPDGNEDVVDLPRFRTLLESGADIVIASRMMTGARNEEDGQLLRWRKWGNLGFNLLANVLFRSRGPFVTDSINGYRAMRRDAGRQLMLNALDYTVEYQMTIRAMAMRMRITEFPTVEGARIAGLTGAPSIPTGLRFLRCLVREYVQRSRWSAGHR